ncbi:hypothetical protein JHK87_021098 [Glycine soja]|nr:hypothetical protein JHK87_021098 [Glycine soja]
MAKVIAGLFAGKIALTYYTDGTGCTLLNGNSTEGHSFASGGDKFYILAKNTHHKALVDAAGSGLGTHGTPSRVFVFEGF